MFSLCHLLEIHFEEVIFLTRLQGPIVCESDINHYLTFGFSFRLNSPLPSLRCDALLALCPAPLLVAKITPYFPLILSTRNQPTLCSGINGVLRI